MSWLLGFALLAVVVVAPFMYLSWYLRWEQERTQGHRYYRLTLPERRRLKRRISQLSRPIRPLVTLLASANRSQAMPSFDYKGVAGPPKVSSPDVFARAERYQPSVEDVFVVTQMRCGTTWMQQVVYEIVTRGRGDLSDHGLGHLYRMSPWIDALTTVSMEEAPLVGERPTRIIKSHLPSDLCPYSPLAKYVYVTRHPVTCFASIADYNRSLLGPLMPPVDALAQWYCSDRMYWRPWPEHVAGFWDWAATRANVFFVHYEEMARDFTAVLDRLSAFLGYSLSAEEKRAIAEKCSFTYMKAHEDLFEMAPPTMFSVDGGEYLKRGDARRQDEVSPALRSAIVDYCRAALAHRAYPAGRYYPDLDGPKIE